MSELRFVTKILNSSVRIRLARWGTRKKPFYRIVVAHRKSPRDGRFIEVVGTYNALCQTLEERLERTKRVELNVDRIRYWISCGAQPSDIVHKLLGLAGVLPPYPQKGATQVMPNLEGIRHTYHKPPITMKKLPNP